VTAPEQELVPAPSRDALYSLAAGILMPPMGLWFRWHIVGLENIPARGPALLAFNHVAYLDPLAIIYACSKAHRRPRFLTKTELFMDRRIRWLLRGTGQIEVRRGTRDAVQALSRALEALGRGEIVAIFPEGTVTTDPDLGSMAPKSGVSRLALAADVPITPCAIWGTSNVWPKGFKGSWRPGQPLLLKIGKPFNLTGSPDSPAAWVEAGRRIMDEIGALVAELRPLVPDRRRPK
jgi:1-acyl-sn-glycerol-3-phosphate acyltransferase